MSLNHVLLPTLVLQELYPNSLIAPDAENKKVQAGTTTTFSYLGNNQKHVIILVKEPETIYLSEETLGFLLDILNACRLTMDDIALINVIKCPVINYKDMEQKLNARIVFFFGVSPTFLQLPLQFPHYQVQHFNNQIYLSAPDLDMIKEDKFEKTKLWSNLKQVFVII